MVGYDDANNALTLGDDDSLEVGDYELKYNSTDDGWQAEYGRPIGGELGAHGDVLGPEYISTGQVGDNSISFTGAPDRIELNDSIYDPNTDFTIAGWINPSAESVRQVIFGSEGNGDTWHFFNNRNDSEGLTYQYNIPGESNVILDTGADTFVSASQGWAHVAITRSVDTWTIYIDGSSVKSATNSVSTIPTLPHLIGADLSNENNRFDGDMDDIRVYNRALSGSEVSNLFNGTDITNGLVGQWNFEYPETPNRAIDSTGDPYPQNSVPRSTSGSLVPQGLAESVAAGEALADDGNTYSSVQDAVNAASGFVFVGPGTFNESVSISTEGLTLEGSGYDTLIDGGTTGSGVEVGASDVNVRNLSVSSTDTGSGTYHGVYVSPSSDNALLSNITVRDSDTSGLDIDSDYCIVRNCTIESCSSSGVNLNGVGHIVSGVLTKPNVGSNGLYGGGQDYIVSNCIFNDPGNKGVGAFFDDSIVIGCRVINAGQNGIQADGIDTIIANCRISDSTNSDIQNTGTGIVLDGNLTGSAN